MAADKTIFVQSVRKCDPIGSEDSDVIYKVSSCDIEGIDNSKIESRLIVSDHGKIIYVPFSQLKFGPTSKFMNEKICVYVVNDFFYMCTNNAPIFDPISDLTIPSTTMAYSTLNSRFTYEAFQKKNLKCLDVKFWISKIPEDPMNPEHQFTYPTPIIKMLLFTCGYHQSTSPVSRLIKDIFPIIFEFYQQIYPLWD